MNASSGWIGALQIALAMASGGAALCPVLGEDTSAALERPRIAIENVAVVDVGRGEAQSPRTVVIADGRITAMGAPDNITIPSGAMRVDGNGRFLIPGLVDMHVHLFNNASRRPPNEWAFPLFVANGVTGVREMRTEPGQVTMVERWRAKVARGESVGPRILAAGVAVSGGNADTTTAARRQVREAKTAGADFVKVFGTLRAPAWRAILDEARNARLPVGGHIPPEVPLLGAAIAGQRSNEHLTQVCEACSAREEEWLEARRKSSERELSKLVEVQEGQILDNFEQAACDRTAAALARTKQVQVPTLVLSFFESRGVPSNVSDDPHWRYLPDGEQARWERIFREEYPVVGDKLAAQRWKVRRQIVKTLHSAGVRILAGTDAPMPQVYPGFSLHQELEMLVESGLSPADALRAATIWPAEFLGLGKSSGSIAKGMRADLLLLDGNPLADIRQTQQIYAVVLDGRLLQRNDLDRLLETSSREAGK